MSTQPTAKRWTYEEFAALPDDGNRYEVIAGELYMTPAPRPLHQVIATELTYLLQGFVKAHDLGTLLIGPIDVLFAEGDYMEPDLVFVRRERKGIISERGVEAAPDLIVEVLSPATARRDRGIKRERYAWFGVGQYWVVDPDQKRIEVYRMTEDPVEPRVVTDTLVWWPAPGGPSLRVDVQELLKGLD